MVKLTKNLYVYDCFKKWSEFNVAWVFSDPHFDDPDCKFMDPNWPIPEEQVKLINSKVGKRDLLFILGDVGNEEWVKKIRGYKVLILGNHDKGASNYIKTYRVSSSGVPDYLTTDLLDAEREREYRLNDTLTDDVRISNDHLFDEVYEGPLMINDHIMLSHEPVNMGFGINIHGHEHRGKAFKELNDGTIRLNVCSNIICYQKQRLDKLIDSISYRDLHRSVIDKAIIRKRTYNVSNDR